MMENRSRSAALFFCLAFCLALCPLWPGPALADSCAPELFAAKGQSVRSQTDRERRQLYSGNVKTKVYHNGQCRHFNCKTCSKVFDSPQEAISKGYRACQMCGG